MKEIVEKRIKVITNAGGLNPLGLKKEIEQLSNEAGFGEKVKVAAIYGDDLLPNYEQLKESNAFSPFLLEGEEEELQEKKWTSMNAYFGAQVTFPLTSSLQFLS